MFLFRLRPQLRCAQQQQRRGMAKGMPKAGTRGRDLTELLDLNKLSEEELMAKVADERAERIARLRSVCVFDLPDTENEGLPDWVHEAAAEVMAGDPTLEELRPHQRRWRKLRRRALIKSNNEARRTALPKEDPAVEAAADAAEKAAQMAADAELRRDKHADALGIGHLLQRSYDHDGDD
jgi:hypothetical protein